MDSSQFSALLHGIRISWGSNTSALAASVFLLYDFLLCFEMEVRHIWKARWSVVKILYLVSRYYGAAHCLSYAVIITRAPGSLSPKFCSNFLWWHTLGGNNLFTTMVNILLALRILALYNKSRKVLIFLVFLLIAELTGEAWSCISTVTLANKHPITLPPSLGIPITGCIWQLPDGVGRNIFAAWIPCLATEFIFFVMTVWKFVQSQILGTQASISIRSLRSSGKFSPFITGFAKDGSLFFFAVFCVILLNTIMSLSDYTVWFLPWVPAIHSFASTRLVLSLKERAYGKIHTADHTFVDTLHFRTTPGAPSAPHPFGSDVLNIHADSSTRRGLYEMH